MPNDFTPLSNTVFEELLNAPEDRCISIIIPTQRATRDTDQNRIAFKTALKSARAELNGEADKNLSEVLEQLAKLDGEADLWSHQHESLAVYASTERVHFIRLPRTMNSFAGVADSFHIKPLIRVMQANDRFQLLAVTQKSVRLYEGDGLSMVPVSLHEAVPKDLVDALGGELDDFHLTVASYKGLRGPAAVHGHHDKSEEMGIDLERYFRTIDKAIWEHHSRVAGVPLILAAVEKYHAIFRRVSKNQHLADHGIKLNPDAADIDEKRLHDEVREAQRPQRHQAVEELVDNFGTARAAGQGSANLADVAKAAVFGKVNKLILAADKRVGGSIDTATGIVTEGELDDPAVDDLLDDIAEHVLRAGGNVHVIPQDIHPHPGSGVAAIYRY
ncbi:MAG: hypothetical protein AAGD32_12290 [Planctomycetota bacterium]